MRRRKIQLLFGILTMLSLAGCSTGIDTVNTENQIETEQDKNDITLGKDEEDILTREQEFALTFAKALEFKSKEFIMNSSNINNSPFINSDDLLWALERTDYGELFGKDLNIIRADTFGNPDNGEVTLEFEDGSKYFFKVIMDENNNFKINLTNLITENVFLSFPKGMKAKINGNTVSDIYKVSETTISNIYQIPAMMSKNTMAKITSTKFGESKQDIKIEKYSSINKPIKISYTIDEKTTKPVLNDLKNMLNEINDIWEKDKDNADFSKFISEKAPDTTLDILKSSVKEQYKWFGNVDNIEYDELYARRNDDALAAELYNNNVIRLNLYAAKSWINKDNNDSRENCECIGQMDIEVTEDGIKIYSIKADKNIIETRNNLVHEW